VIQLAPEDFGKIKVLVRWSQKVDPQSPASATRTLAQEAFVSPEKPSVVLYSGHELWPIRVVSADLAALPKAFVGWKTALHSESRQVDLNPLGTDGLFLLPVNPEAPLAMRVARTQYAVTYAVFLTIDHPGVYQIQPDGDASSTKLTLVPIQTMAWPDDPA
jgi:hypothetical protein